MSSHCWLCTNSTNETSRKMNQFIMQNIATIGVDAMSGMINKHLEEMHPGVSGISKTDIKDHIQKGHSLSPLLQISHILRSLLEIRDTLQGMLIIENEDGVKTVDARCMSIYLKVITEIMQIYRTGDFNKLLFISDEKSTSKKD